MAVTDFNTLRDTVVSWAGGSSDPRFSAAVEDAIGMAEATLSRTLRVPEMEKRTVRKVSGDWTDLPGDFRAVRALFQGDLMLRAVRPDVWHRVTAHGDRPRLFTVSGLQFAVAPHTVGSSYDVRMIYYADVPKLNSGTALCTAVLQRYPDAYLYSTLAALEGWLIHDERIAVWKQQAVQAVLEANRSAARRAGP